MASAVDLPVELVEEIFLRLDDAADLVRASAACAAFRRVVSDGRFLRRYRSLHRPPVLGLLSRGFRFHPAEPPRRSAQAARAVERAAGFSSSFLHLVPTEHYWRVHDARDGRVLLSPSRSNSDAGVTCLSFSYLVVFDPLNYKHVHIPPIPNDLVACTCTEQHVCRCCCACACEFDPFLVPAATADEDDLSFRVMCTVLSIDSNNLLETFVYSSVTGKWCSVASLSHRYYKPVLFLFSWRGVYMERHYAHGCFFWVDPREKDMLMLDMNEMKFSVICLPPETKRKFKIVVKAAEEDRIGLLVRHENTLHLYTKAFGGANDCWQWRHDAVITLLDSYQWFFGGAADQGYALLLGIPRDEYLACRSSPDKTPTSAHYFTVEFQKLVVEQLCVSGFDTKPAFLYASFPPPFALPSIGNSVCIRPSSLF